MFADSFRRRMLPMYAAKFLRNVVFWYSIEKIFMTSIGFTNETIAIMVALYSATSIIMEVPSGILADRWSRKGVLALAAVSLIASSLVGGLSNSVAIYLISAVLWGFFDALGSGTDDSIIYDTLIEERGHADDFEKEYGFYSAISGIALVIAGVGGGFVGQYVGLSETYLLSIIPVLISIPIILRFREPSFHKFAAETHLIAHTRDTFRVVFRNPNLIWILITLFAIGLANGLPGEMHQLWLIALAAPIVLTGIASSAVNSTWGFAGYFSRFLTTKRAVIFGICLALMCALSLAVSRNVYVTSIALFALMMCAHAVFIATTAQLHRQLPSRVRAGASSATNTVARLLNIPLVLGFGWIAANYSIFTASWIIVALITIALISELAAHHTRRHV
jgi:predicted MFS family arabinose efflux permease